MEAELRSYRVTTVPCPYCGAKEGYGCKTKSGRPRTKRPHTLRCERYMNCEMVHLVGILKGDGHVKAGETYWAVRYRADPEKAVLFQREKDGWDPERNEYWFNLIRLGWIPRDEWNEWKHIEDLPRRGM